MLSAGSLYQEALPMLNNDSVKRLCLYNLFNALAIAPATNLIFMDKLMLRMELELTFIGYIKGFMYLAPAVLYFLMVPVLRRLQADVKITIYCYLARVILPVILPILALMTGNKTILTLACIFVLSGAMTLAGFANNSLMAIYRMAIPKETFNKDSGLITLCTNLPATIMGLPLAWILDLCEGAPGYWFYIVFALIHIACIFFEIPAIKNLRALPELKYPSQKHRQIYGAALRPFLDRKYQALLGLCFLNMVVYGMGTAYLMVYLLKERKFSIALLTGIALALRVVGDFILPATGRITDRIGYSRLFFILSGAMLTGNVLFCIFWEENWVLIPFAILAWNGVGSVVGGILFWGLSAAGSKLARPALSENYIATFSLCSNGGIFAGAMLASLLMETARKMGGQDPYYTYFLMTLFFPILLFLCAAIYRYAGKGKKRMSR